MASDESAGDATDAQPLSIELTESAAERLQSAIDGHDKAVAGIRLSVTGRGPTGFQHSLSLIEEGEDVGDDRTFEAGGITVFVEARNAEYLNGVSIDVDSEAGGGMLTFDNPNPLWRDAVAAKLQELFDSQINPQIAAHGGTVSLLAVEGKVAYIELGGGCVGCGMVDVTLKQGIEVAIRDSVPEIEQVVDSTDHGSGSNPYYKPSKK